MKNCKRSIGPLAKRVFVTQVLILLSLGTTSLVASQVKPQHLASPPTISKPLTESIHGVTITDPYRWLEDGNSPETRKWIEEQNLYTRKILDEIPGRKSITSLVSTFLRLDTCEPPLHRNGHYFFTRKRASDDLSMIYLRRGDQGKDKLLIDPQSLSPDHSKSVDLIAVSNDGHLLAYSIRDGGEDEVILRLFDVRRRKDLSDGFPKARYSNVEFTPDGKEFYYAKYSEQGERIYLHTIGTDSESDVLIFGEDYAPGIGIDVNLSDDGRYILFIVHHGSAAPRTEVYFMDLAEERTIQTVVNNIDAFFSGSSGGNCLYLLTNWDAPNGRIIVVDLDNPRRSAWQSVVGETHEIIENLSLAGGYLVLTTINEVIPAISILTPDGQAISSIQMLVPGSIGNLRGRWSDDILFFSYSSFNIPPTVYSYDLSKFTKSIWARVDAPIESDELEVKQVWYESRDGTRVPMFLAHKRGLELDGKNPALLMGYGGFRVSMKPYFSGRSAAWLKLGGVYAVANLRGGGEFGENWHRDGMLMRKQNTFDDFIAAAQYLIQNRYTNPSKLAIWGGSNGGLLVGAALTQKPELFKAAVCMYPLLDMIRYHKFLVAKFWVPEYGSAEDPEQFRYLLAYSPYHNIRNGVEYPAALFVTGDSDTRVDPLHARKMTALLQASTSSSNPVLLHYDTIAGHAGEKPTSRAIEDLTDYLSFLVWQLGIDLAPAVDN